MAFDDVTLFEVHLDGPQFGGRSDDRSDGSTHEHDDHEPTAEEPESSGGKGRSALKGLVVLGLFVAAAALVRRRLGEEGEIEYETEEYEAELEYEPSEA